MLAIHSLTTQLRNQTLTGPPSAPSPTAPPPQSTAAAASVIVTSAGDGSEDDDNALKVRHHSEPQPPSSSSLPDSSAAKKVKVITFEDGVVQKVSSLLLTAQSTSASWDASSYSNPPKRQCRSMSIPNDRELQTRWLQTQRRLLHRPLPVRPGSGSRSKSHHYNHHRSTCRQQPPPPPVWSSLAPSDFTSPPESPRSRPSSASSGYFDSPLASSSNLNKNRCLSLQALQSITAAQPSNPSSNTTKQQGALSGHSSLSAKSMPSVSLDSLQSSPHKQLLRCQSQPCVANERRCGMKRRHDDEYRRPSLNFNKMTETAVVFGTSCDSSSLPKSPTETNTTPSLPLTIRPCNRYGNGGSGIVFPDRVLQTIASSPQDAVNISSSLSPTLTSDKPSPPVNLLTSPSHSPVCLLPPSHSSADSDSGCSTTDDELCQITSGMEGSNDTSILSLGNTVDRMTSCRCGSSVIRPINSNNTTNKGRCDCHQELCPSSTCLSDAMFPMDSGGLVQDGELDIDMIENN